MSKPIWADYAGPNGFWGYGSRWEEADVIFIGPEFGGSDVEKRIDYWEETHRNNFTDLRPFMQVVDRNNKFVTNGTLSGTRGIKTFGSLMVMLMGAKPLALRKSYAQHCFGRSDLSTKISWSDLSALPCKNVSKEEFAEAYAPYKLTRSIYHDVYLPPRIEHLRQFFSKSEGKTVVLYGTSDLVMPIFEGSWISQQIEEHYHGFDLLQSGQHTVIRVAHPCAHRVKNGYFEECGRRICILNPEKFESEVKARSEAK